MVSNFSPACFFWWFNVLEHQETYCFAFKSSCILSMLDPAGVWHQAGPRRDFREAHDTDTAGPWKCHQPAVHWTMTCSNLLWYELQHEPLAVAHASRRSHPRKRTWGDGGSLQTDLQLLTPAETKAPPPRHLTTWRGWGVEKDERLMILR